MKLSISNIAWAAENDDIMYAKLKELGFRGLEIAPTRILPESPYDHIPEAKNWADNLNAKYGLEIPSMQSIWYGRSEKIFGDAADRKVLIDYTKKAVLFAEAIGCRNLVLGCPMNRDTDDVQGNYPVAIEFFKAIGNFAEEHNTVIAVEPNPTIYNTHFINYTEQAVELAYKSCSEGVKVNVDLGTIIYNEEDINYLQQIPEFINHVHISEPGLNIIEHCDLHKQLFAILNEIHYNHYVSLEMGNKGSMDAVDEAMNYVKGLNE